MFLRDLQYFCAAARVENIARAAESLGASQPTVSKAISRLERQLGVRLFERLARGVRLSPAGTAFLRYANGANNLLRDAAAEMREFRQNQAGVIRIGVGVGITETLLEDAIERASNKHPSLRFEIRGGMADTLLDSLDAALIDLVITGVAAQPRSGLRWKTLYTDRQVFAAPREHSLVRARTVSIAQLASSRLILPAPGTVTRAWADALFIAEGIQPPLPFIESHASAREIPLAVRFGCVVLLPESVFQTSAFGPKLSRLNVPDHWDMARPISVVTRATRFTNHMETILEALTESTTR
ncbi:MAG: LysR family transcriptional regulator [Rhodoferax sp.]|nr:LysR family transcriptional regulator [Rhodoferax sp.]